MTAAPKIVGFELSINGITAQADGCTRFTKEPEVRQYMDWAEKRIAELAAENSRVREAAALAADRLDAAAGRVTDLRAAFGVREWAKEARTAAQA